MQENIFNIKDFGAINDGRTDCTLAIQNAIDQAAKVQGTVLIPAGVFLTNELKLKPFITLKGDAKWSYRNHAGSILKLFNADNRCLLNITAAQGVKITDLCLDGANLGTDIHGVATIRHDDEPLKEEDTTCIDHIRVANFSGDGLHMQRIWCFSVRHSQIGFNHGNGLYIKGWDAFITDNWFSNNYRCGILSDKEMSAIVITGNRLEWNGEAGLKAINPICVNITGNAFDSAGGPGLDLNNPQGSRAINVTVVANTFNRSGMPLIRNEFSGLSCHVHIVRAINLVMQSNSFFQGFDDSGDRSLLCPETGIIIQKLKSCIIKDNAMFNCATKNVYLDLGEHLEGNDINITGSVKPTVGAILYPFFDD
ncbi:MAG: glycosyl hydrolase family 28-related protein [Bacilli bacterium]